MAEPFALKLTLDLKSFRSGLAGVRAGLNGLVGEVKSSFGGVAGGLNVLANGVHVVRGAIDGLRASFNLLTQFSEQGQQLEEGGSKFEAVFKEVTASAHQFAVTLSSDVGRSVVLVKNALADTQGVLSGFGFDRAKAAEISQTIIKLGIDLASFNNTSDDEAFGALRSGLLGEAEALKKFGVAITEASVQQTAFQLGFDPSNLNEQEKVLTRLAIITKSTADAQGDAVRTSDSFANQAKRLSGVLFDLAANVGKGINEAIKPFIAGITKFLDSNKAAIQGAVDGLTASIQTGLEAAFSALGGTAERAGQSIINIFTEMPATLDAVAISLGQAKDFAFALFDVLTGGTQKSNANITEATSIFERFEAALTAPGAITALAQIRYAVAAVSGGVAALYQVGQLSFAGLQGLFATFLVEVQAVLQGLSNLPGLGFLEDAADSLGETIISTFDDAVARAETAFEKIGEIADLTTREMDDARFDIANADKLGKKFQEQAKLRRDSLKTERDTALAAKATADAENKKAEAARLVAGENKKTEVSLKDQKAAQDALKKAIDETLKVEEQIAEAKVKATETLRDDIALIRERIVAEIKAAKTAEEASQIRKRGILQESALIADAQKKQAEAAKKRAEEDKRAAKSLKDFLGDQNRSRRRASGLNSGADAEENLARVAAQSESIRTPGDRDALLKEIDATELDALDKRTESVRQISQKMTDLREALKSARATQDFDEVLRLQDEIRESQVEYNKTLTDTGDGAKVTREAAEEARQKVIASFESIQKTQAEAAAAAEDLAKSAESTPAAATPSAEDFANFAHVSALMGNSALRPALEFSSDSGAASGATDVAAAATPVDGAVETLRGVIEGANAELRKGLESLATGLGNLATAAQEILNSSVTIFPQAIASLDSVLTSQQQNNHEVISLGTAMRDKLLELATGLGATNAQLAALSAEVKVIKVSTTGAVDARTAGL